MKVLQIIDNLNTGGAEKQFRDINRAFIKESRISTFFYFPCWDKARTLPEDYLQPDNNSFTFYKSHKMDIFKIVGKLNRVIRRIKPDIVHSWLYYSNLVNILSFKSAQKKIISQRSDYRYCLDGGMQHLFRGMIMKFTHKKADAVVVNSISNYDYLLKRLRYPAEKINYIQNGIFIPDGLIKKEYALDGGKVRILYIANFKREKNHYFLIPFMDELRKKYQLKLILIGQGPLYKEFSEKVKLAKLTDFVEYRGTVENAYKENKYFDIFVYPSLHEGLPNALMEAMACGLPVISSNAGGCKDLIRQGENGFLFDSGNLSDFIKLTSTLIENRSLRERIGNNAAKDMKDRFSLDSAVSKYNNLYLKLAG
jgi:glycosyltransferase involved in cell wall biosynthesis